MKRLAIGLLFLAQTALAAGVPVPPHLAAMWHGHDDAAVRALLRSLVVTGDDPEATPEQRLEAGQAAYWLGVQHDLAGRLDSARIEWRRALRLRGGHEEGFALLDASESSSREADRLEARAIAVQLVDALEPSDTRLGPQIHARSAWALARLGRADSAARELRAGAPNQWRQPLWTRRAMRIQLAGGDLEAAWRSALALAVQGRGLDHEADSVLASLTRRLGRGGERYPLARQQGLEQVRQHEASFVGAWEGRAELLSASDGAPIQCFVFPAREVGPPREAVLMILAPEDTLSSARALVQGFLAAGSPVVLLAPRGSYGSRSALTPGPEVWIGRAHDFERITTRDAVGVLRTLMDRPAFKGRGWVIGGAGDRALTALRVAETIRGARALLLVNPRVPTVALADYRDRLRRTPVRTFVQVSPEEMAAGEFADLLAQDTPAGQVRVGDTLEAGRGLAVLGADPRIMPRILAWLREGAKSR